MFIPSGGQDQSLTIGEQNLKILDRLQNITPNREIVKAMEPPKTQALKHVKTNWKRMQQEEDKVTEIERENRILLQKMKKIYCKSTTNTQKPNENHRHASKSISEASFYGHGNQSQFSQGGSILAKQSQHQRKLLKEKEKIDMENQLMLKRLQNKRSNYNIDQWQKDEENRQMILKRVSIMPRNSSATEIAGEAALGAFLHRNDSHQSNSSSLKTSQRAHQQIERAKHLKKQLHFNDHSVGNGKGTSAVLHCRPMDLEPGRIVLYKKALLIDHVYYICEISYNKRGYFISLFSVEFQDQNMTLHLKNGDRTEKILKSYSHDFDKIAHSLVLRNGRISLPPSPQYYELSTLDPIFEYDKKQDLKSNQKLLARESAERRERQLPPSLSHYHQIIKKNVSLNELENAQFKQKLKMAKYANQRETQVAEGGPRDLLPDRFGYFKPQNQSTENMPALLRDALFPHSRPDYPSMDGSHSRSSKASKMRRDMENQILLTHMDHHITKTSNTKLRHRQDSKLRLKNRAQQLANISKRTSQRNKTLGSNRSLHKTEQRRHLHADSLADLNADNQRVYESLEGLHNQSCLDIIIGNKGENSLRGSNENVKQTVLAASHYDQDQSYDRNYAYDSREYQQAQSSDENSKFSKNQYHSVDRIHSLEQNEIYTNLRKKSKNPPKFKVLPDDCPAKPLFFYNHLQHQQSSPGISIQNQLQRPGVDRYASVETYFGASLDQVNSLHADGKRNHPSAQSSNSGSNMQTLAFLGKSKNSRERGLAKSTSKQSLNNGIYFNDGTQVKLRPKKIIQKQSIQDKRNSENVFERLSKPSAFQLEQNARYQKERQQKTKVPTKNTSPKRLGMPAISKTTIEKDKEQGPTVKIVASTGGRESLRRLKQPEAESQETDFSPQMKISFTNETKQQLNQKAKLHTSHLPRRSIGGQKKSNALTPTRNNDDALVNISLKKDDEPAIEDNYSGFAGQTQLARATSKQQEELEQQYRDFKPYNYYENSQDSRRQPDGTQNHDNADHLSQNPNSQTSVYRETHESGFSAFRKQSFRGAQSTYNCQQSRMFDQVKHAIQPPSMLDEIKREVSEYSMSQKNFLMKQRKKMGMRNAEADGTSTVNHGSEDRSPSVQSILNTEEQEKMNRTGQFSMEPSQNENQQTSFYTEGNSKTISKNNEEAKILYDLNDASAKTMNRKHPTRDLTRKSGQNMMISDSNRTNDELERQDRVGPNLQSELKKNYGIKPNIHIHMQTKDNTAMATNSDTKDHDVYKQLRDSTQKNADALYESNNEEEESKDVVIAQIPVDDHLANLDRKRKSNGSNARGGQRSEELPSFQRTDSQVLNASHGSLLNVRNSQQQMEQSRKSIITMGQIGAKTKRDLSTNRDDKDVQHVQSLPDEVPAEQLQEPSEQPRTLKATVSGRLDIANLDVADQQDNNRANQQFSSQLSSIRMISASKDVAKPYEEIQGEDRALLLAHLNNNSSSNSIELSTGKLRSPEVNNQIRFNQDSQNEQEFKMIQNSSNQDDFNTFGKDENHPGGRIGEENDYAQNLYSPLGKKHGRSQMYEQELVTANARNLSKQRSDFGQQVKSSGINSQRIEVKNGLNMYHQRHVQPANPALRGLIHQSSEVNSSLMTNKTAGFGQPVYESIETFGQNHTNGGNSIKSKQSVKPSLITDPHRAKSSLDMSEFSFQERVQPNVNTGLNSGLRFKRSHNNSRDLKSNSVSHQLLLPQNISVPGSSRALQSPSFVVSNQQNTTENKQQHDQDSLMLIENSNNDYVEQHGRATKPYHALVQSRAPVTKTPAGDRLQYQRVQQEFEKFVKDDLDIIDDDDFKVIQQVLKQENQISSKQPNQEVNLQSIDKSTTDLPIIEENPENAFSTMKGSKVTTPKEVIEEKISIVSQEDQYSDEEYEVIDEAEELQQEQQQVRESHRSSNQNHIRDQIQAMDDGTSFNSDLQMTANKPAVIDNQREEDNRINNASSQSKRLIKANSPIDQRAMTQQDFNKQDSNNHLFESNRNLVQQVNNLDSVKSKDSYSMDFTTENNESRALNNHRNAPQVFKAESSRDDNDFSDVPSQSQAASHLDLQRKNTKSSVPVSNQTFERASSRDQFTQSQLAGDLIQRKSSFDINQVEK